MSLEVTSDGKTVWINDSNGHCVARFGPRGIDIHRPLSQQITTGKQCLDCRMGMNSWDEFLTAVKSHFNFDVPNEHRPLWSK